MWFNWNGNIVKEGLFTHDNRSLRYGDGLFESVALSVMEKYLIENHMKIV